MNDIKEKRKLNAAIAQIDDDMPFADLQAFFKDIY